MHAILIEQAQDETDDVLEQYEQFYLCAVPLDRPSRIRAPRVFDTTKLIALLGAMRKCVVRVLDLQWYVYSACKDPAALQMCKWCETTLSKITRSQHYANRMNNEALMLADVRREQRQQRYIEGLVDHVLL